MIVLKTKFLLHNDKWYIWWIDASHGSPALSPVVADCHFEFHLFACSHRTSIPTLTLFAQTLFFSLLFFVFFPIRWISSLLSINNPSENRIYPSENHCSSFNIRTSIVHSHSFMWSNWCRNRLNCLLLFTYHTVPRWMVGFFCLKCNVKLVVCKIQNLLISYKHSNG